MDLHPLFVHFPIALLTLYSLLELVHKFTKAAYWVRVRFILLVTGSIGAFVSSATGEQAEHMLRDQSLRSLVEMHSLFAGVTTWIYAALAVCYVVVLYSHTPVYEALRKANTKFANMLLRVCTKIVQSPLVILLAFLGLVALTFTGALGASIVYGPDFDPFTQFVYNLLF